jgi:hypothetical protein
VHTDCDLTVAHRVGQDDDEVWKCEDAGIWEGVGQSEDEARAPKRFLTPRQIKNAGHADPVVADNQAIAVERGSTGGGRYSCSL